MSQVTDELRIVEEFLLLVLDSDHGDIRHSFPLPSRAVAFAGAALMDLALEQRIKTDLSRPEMLAVSDPTPLGSDLLDREVFYTLLEARVLTERYRRTYNRIRPHSSLGYRPPAPEALLPADPVPVPVGLT